MCSCTPHLFLAHALGLGLGVMFIAELVRRGTPNRLFWTAVGLQSLVMAVVVFHTTRGHYFSDFIKAYWPGGQAALKGREEVVDLYRQGIESFVNIPIIAYLFAPFALLPPLPAALVMTLPGLVAAFIAWRLLGDAAHLDRKTQAVLLFLYSAFGPLLYSIREGNTSHIVLALVVWAFLLLRERRDFLAGAALAAAALIKLPLMLFGIYYALRGRWSVVFGGGVVVGTAALLSLLVFGWDAHVVWYELSVRPYARDPLPALNVQSIAGALARMELGPGSPLDWSPHQLSAPLQIIASGSTFLLLAMAAASALAPRPSTAEPVSRDIPQEVEFLIVLMLACIISPLSWSHYYVWMLMPVAFFVGRTPHFSSTVPVRALGWVAIVLAAGPITLLSFSNTLLEELAARLGSSRLLFGGLAILGLLIWSRWQMQHSTTKDIAETDRRTERVATAAK